MRRSHLPDFDGGVLRLNCEGYPFRRRKREGCSRHQRPLDRQRRRSAIREQRSDRDQRRTGYKSIAERNRNKLAPICLIEDLVVGHCNGFRWIKIAGPGAFSMQESLAARAGIVPLLVMVRTPRYGGHANTPRIRTVFWFI